AAPRYFRGELALGGLMQTVGAFSQVQDSLSFFVQSYKEVAEWCSVVERLAGFDHAIERVRREAAAGAGVRHAEGDGKELVVTDVDLYLPGGQPLITSASFSARRGGR